MSSIFYLILIGCNSIKKKNFLSLVALFKTPDDKVLLMKKWRNFDSIPLDENASFHISIPNKTSNLYIFKHGIEHQQVFLEPGDSVSVFVNTKDFDESLTYHGNGAKKNNFLIRSFLKMKKTN